MKNLLQKTLFILFIAFASCQEEQSIITEAPESDQNITSDSIIYDKLSKVSTDDTIECINFVYPISFSIYDSNNQVLRNESVNNDEELNDLLSSINSPDFDGSFIELNYPLSLVNSENETITVYSNQELVEVLSTENNCDDLIDNLFACVFGLFQLDINVIDSDENPNDGITALEEYEAGTIPLKILDIDANGSFDALTDGLIILRYAFGLRGQSLIDDVISEDAMRAEAADIETYIETLLP